MAQGLILDSTLTDIADAIREKTGESGSMLPGEMAAKIAGIQVMPQGFELYAADHYGSQRNEIGCMDNTYFVCFFHDNMANAFTLNGETKSFGVVLSGYSLGKIKASTLRVQNTRSAEVVINRGSQFYVQHDDGGSYISVVGGWVGYPGSGRVYEQGAEGTVNSIALDSAHDTLLVFVGASSRNFDTQNNITVNGTSYTVTNIGTFYDGVYSLYGAIIIEGNKDTAVSVTFPASCWNYVSVVGIDTETAGSASA